MRRLSVGACAVLGALVFLLPVVVAQYDEYEGSDVIVYGGSVLALVGAALGAAVGILLRLRRSIPSSTVGVGDVSRRHTPSVSEDERGGDPDHDRVLRDLLALVEQFGWAVRHVFAVTEDQVDFSYTVGLTAMQHPEVIVMGMPQEHAHTFLNHIGEDVRNGMRYEDGTTTDELTEPGAPVVFIRAEQVDRLTAVEEVYGRVDALQMVWCDSLGHLPWQEGYRNGPEVQPLLGRTDHVR